MAKRFSGNDFACVANATRFSLSVRTVIGDTAIAAPGAASKPASSSGGVPTGGTNRARKGGSIIVTGSESTGAAAVRGKLA